jgi:Asp-tRNA(Asn)/Glu-tRNA(Gln) amidotransferase A subunit family amidase
MHRRAQAALSIAMVIACAQPADAAPALSQGAVCVENATLTELREALLAGRTTATALTQAYLARIAAYDRNGPALNAVRELNPDALGIAAQLDTGKPDARLPLWGIPILIKDNIATGDQQHTTAGSLALASARAKRDATVVTQLRRAGAVIIGKTNLTEFANILAVNMPSGYSSLGGQVRNPYAPALNDRGVPFVLPGGSSSGSAVAVAAGLAAVSIGTETSGSLLSPANMNGLVTVKPTVGLISRAGILPIAASQDTAGPMTRTVRDAALMLNVLAARDPMDAATRPQQRPADYTASLNRDGLKGARIGVPSDSSDPANDVYYGSLPPPAAQVMRNAIAALEREGAVIIRVNIPTIGWMGGPSSDMPILNLNPESQTKNQPQRVEERAQRLSARLGDGNADQVDVRHRRVQQGECLACASLRAGHLPRVGSHARRSVRARIQSRAPDGHPHLTHARGRRLYGGTPAGRDPVSRQHRRSHRGEGRLSERAGSRGLRCGRQSELHARLPVRRHVHRTRLERTHIAAPRLRVRAGDHGAQDAARRARA